MNNNILKAGMIAGGSIGAAAGFMTRGQELEESGQPSIKQVAGGISHGLMTGVVGVGVGAGSVGVASALKGILKK